ncbi:MAG: hypothetical protein PHR77_17705 [Kiritimatiellae bacterium]|nr:hypothetical protein [Kiritimatiellia bacterium]MDD5521265.1 hypothetical protein [Kiritimatiellia bacterium]
MLGRFSWLALVITGLAALLLVRAYYGIPAEPEPDNQRINLVDKLSSRSNLVIDCSVFQSREGNVLSSPGTPTSSRFRLAGTFFEYLFDENSTGSTGEIKRAIIDDLKNGNQAIVREGEKIDDITVIKIFNDRVVLRDNSGLDEQLWLTFSGLGAASKVTTGTNDVNLASGAQIQGIDKFGGKQVGERRWVFSREKLLEYYQGLRDEPDRLVKVFDSLKPVYDGKTAGRIGGYRLGVEGESDFFKSVGLQEGDVVRSVNSMQMTNRRRAEYFISEFVSDRANAFILEVERGGKQEKLLYEVR